MKISRSFVLKIKRPIGLLVFGVAMSSAWADEAIDFVAEVKKHYESTRPIDAFSLKYHFLNRRYQDHSYWDYKTPNLYMSQRVVEVDLEKRHFYDNDIVYYSGGRLFDRAQFQNDKESFFYERSATSLGKAVIRRGMDNFDRFIGHIVMNVDFLAVRPLLEEIDVERNVTLHQDIESGTTTLIHKRPDENAIDYTFSHDPLQLVSINHRTLNGIFVYHDYQTTRGITYARSVYQYYDGETVPTYIKFNDNFRVIDEVEPAKLRLPEGYGSELQTGDGVLVSNEITEGLYLITDSSSVINSLLKVNGDNMTVFGATVNEATAEKVIKFVNDEFTGKKITSVYVTHPHGHQISGLKPFVELGAEILADAYSISAIKAFPDFSAHIGKFKFKQISHEQVIDGIQFYVLENMHAKRQSFVHFKDAELIFQSHFIHVPLDNTIAKVIPSYTRTFIEFVRSKCLNFNRIIGNYRNNDISVEVMNKIYDVNI